MTDETAPVEISEIVVDIDRDIMLNAIDAFSKTHLSPISYTIIREALDEDAKNQSPMEVIYEKLGRAIFNQIVTDAIHAKLSEEGFEVPE